MSAIISKDGEYRYRLDRELDNDGPPLGVIMINPSTADAEVDDATIRSLLRICRDQGFGHLTVGNLFAYRSTDVKALADVLDPVGSENEHFQQQIIEQTVQQGGKVVVAWGDEKKIPKSHVWAVLDFLWLYYEITRNRPLHCFGFTKNGSPKHPLFLKSTTPIEVYDVVE